jgi:hypothetical protein
MNMAAMEFATAGERKFARKLINAMLESGYTVSVNDGEEWTVKKSTSTTEIINALCTTGEDYVRARYKDGTVVGTFTLIWGNDEDGSELIADHSDNEACNELYRLVYPD